MRVKRISEGLSNDTELLINKFLETNSVRFEDFATIWKSLKFSLVYMGKECEQELHEFIEDAFRVALNYIASNGRFQAKIGGLYLLYSLYLKQPMNLKFKIRITLQQWQSLQAVVNAAKRENHLDACYVWFRLVAAKAFQFVAYELTLGPRSTTLGEVIDIEASKRFDELSSPIQSFSEEGYLEQLEAVHEQYEKMKEVQPSLCTSLNVVSTNIFPDLIRKLDELRSKHQTATSTFISNEQDMCFGNEGAGSSGDDPKEKSCSNETEVNIGTRRANLRQQQFAAEAVVKSSRRHRQTEVAKPSDTVTRKRAGRHTNIIQRSLRSSQNACDTGISKNADLQNPGPSRCAVPHITDVSENESIHFDNNLDSSSPDNSRKRLKT